MLTQESNLNSAQAKKSMDLHFLERNAAFEAAGVCVLPVPYEGTVCFRGGAEKGPEALLNASVEVEEYDIELGFETIGEGFPEGFHVMGPVGREEKDPEKVVGEVYGSVSKIVGAGKFPIAIGGEHSISSGALNAVAEKFPGVSVLQIDAHADLRDSFEGGRHSHACAMRRMMDYAKGGAQVGVRSMSAECADYLGKNPELKSWGSEFEIGEVLDALGESVYVSIDLDGFDPSEMPGVGTPCPGGLSWKQGMGLLREVAKNKKIVGFDVVELAPIEGEVVSELFAANLLYKLAGYSVFPERLRQV
ncbi:agmatinase [Candidatus Micrarchaeota archaeon]|nr:agmatinase [Candidatus Micrarchaeota archaeon]MBD3417753.1 agmatinase [Candidatus Micrarchaeota archaeon]